MSQNDFFSRKDFIIVLFNKVILSDSALTSVISKLTFCVREFIMTQTCCTRCGPLWIMRRQYNQLISGCSSGRWLHLLTLTDTGRSCVHMPLSNYGQWRGISYCRATILFSTWIRNKWRRHLSEWTDKARQTDDAAVSKQLGHLWDAPDVFLTVLRTEAEVLVKSMTNVVAVQTIRWNSLTHQVAF